MQTRSTKVSTPKESKKRNRTMGTESGDCVNQSNFGEGIVQFYTGAAKDVGDNIGFQDGNTPKSKQTTLLSHWLFSDEASAPKQQKMVKRGINRPDADVEKSAREFNQTTKHSIESAHASTVDTLHDVPVIAAPSGMPVMTTGFTTASGKPCPVMNPEEKKKMRKLLGLDSIGESDLDLNLPTVGNIDLSMPVGIGDINNEANELSVHSIDTATESPRGPDSLDSITAIAEAIDMADFDGLTTTKDVTIVVDQDLEDRMLEKVECVANTERKYVYANSTKAVTLLELWCRNCIVTNHDGSSLSPAMLARLWNVYGNPLIVDYETIENFTFINYSPCDGIITVGGLKEMQQCFRQLLEECVEKSVERHRFDEQWLRKKYCIFALSVCRKFQKALFKAMHNGGTLKEALLRVRLPNPLSVIRQIIKAFHDEYGGKESILTCILQGDAPANSPVVVMVEHIDGNYLNISDGMSTFTAFAADCYVRQLLKSQRIVPGSKILLNGILIGSDKKGDGDAIIQINYNMVSPAPRRRIGLQNKHGNMHIRGKVYSENKT
ncbi:annexin A8-like isoform X3, putative [Babesia ovis]|uniref:Annexin A8-like isoform X3, putative n=1 Tax=Babesia ovis TaxID=5869 RepID=A0A9W5TAR4_BABOV|nr:annexin A8-like isoform X3, putative [Babesia ovis]